MTARDQGTIPGAGPPLHSPRAARPVRPQPAPGAEKDDWPVPAELDLQDLCAGTAEREELDEVWTSLFIFIALFLLSVTYGASVTLCKVGRRRAGRPAAGGSPGRAGPHVRPPAGAVGLGRRPATGALPRPRLRQRPGAGSLGLGRRQQRPRAPPPRA